MRKRITANTTPMMTAVWEQQPRRREVLKRMELEQATKMKTIQCNGDTNYARGVAKMEPPIRKILAGISCNREGKDQPDQHPHLCDGWRSWRHPDFPEADRSTEKEVRHQARNAGDHPPTDALSAQHTKPLVTSVGRRATTKLCADQLNSLGWLQLTRRKCLLPP